MSKPTSTGRQPAAQRHAGTTSSPGLERSLPLPPVARNGAHAPATQTGSRAREQLLEAACDLIRELGHVPSIVEVARAAGLSRATAYRCFSSRSKLVAAVVDHSLGPVRRFESSLDKADERLAELFGTTFVRFQEFEPQMRSALKLSLEHEALQAAGRLEEEPYRRGYRIDILQRTLAPLAHTMPLKSFDRLCKAMSLLFGIEPYVVLKDIWNCDNDEVGRIALWMANALLREAQRDAAAGRC